MLQQEIWQNPGDSRAQRIDRTTGLRARTLRDGFAMLVSAVRQSYRRQIARRRAHLAALELARFDDRRLRDIGVERADIPEVTRGLAGRADDVGKRSKTPAPLRPTSAAGAPGLSTRQGAPAACCG